MCIALFETVSQSARSIGELMTLNLLWVLLVGCAAFLMARRMRSPGCWELRRDGPPACLDRPPLRLLFMITGTHCPCPSE